MLKNKFFYTNLNSEFKTKSNNIYILFNLKYFINKKKIILYFTSSNKFEKRVYSKKVQLSKSCANHVFMIFRYLFLFCIFFVVVLHLFSFTKLKSLSQFCSVDFESIFVTNIFYIYLCNLSILFPLAPIVFLFLFILYKFLILNLMFFVCLVD